MATTLTIGAEVGSHPDIVLRQDFSSASSVSAIIKMYGGNQKFAKHFGWAPSRTSNWSAFNLIPLPQALVVWADMVSRGETVPPAVLAIPKIMLR